MMNNKGGYSLGGLNLMAALTANPQFKSQKAGLAQLELKEKAEASKARREDSGCHDESDDEEDQDDYLRLDNDDLGCSKSKNKATNSMYSDSDTFLGSLSDVSPPAPALHTPSNRDLFSRPFMAIRMKSEGDLFGRKMPALSLNPPSSPPSPSGAPVRHESNPYSLPQDHIAMQQLQHAGASDVSTGSAPYNPESRFCSYLMKKGGGSNALSRRWRKRWFQIFFDKLIYQEKSCSSEPLGVIDIPSIISVEKFELGEHAYEFRIITNTRIYCCVASCATKRDEWISRLMAAQRYFRQHKGIQHNHSTVSMGLMF